MVKIRIADLHVFCPNDPLDCRISVNLEADYNGPVDDLRPSNSNGVPRTRTKDRLSYEHQFISVDLTQVTTDDGGLTHELELEMDTNTIMQEGKLIKMEQPNSYEPIVGVFMNYIRVVNRASNL
jgi:hypothetical protein